MRELFAATLLAGLVGAASEGAAEIGPSAREMGERTAAFAQRYLQNWSSNDESAVGNVPLVYGPMTRFYGRPYSQADLTAEKRRAVRLWPVRDYRIRPGSLAVTCDMARAVCAARSVIVYRVAHPAGGRSARGAARFDLEISFAGPRPLIVYEEGTRARELGPS